MRFAAGTFLFGGSRALPRANKKMSPRRARNSPGYVGVCACPTGNFYAEICTGDRSIGLGTFDMAHEAARAMRRCGASAGCDGR
jgi:hypothetical protein